MNDRHSPTANQVLNYYRLVDAGDIAGIVELFAPNAQYSRPGYDPFVGRAALEAFYRNQRAIRRGKHTVRSLVEGVDAIAVQGEFTGTLRTGESISLRFADFFEVAPDGNFARRDTYFYQPMV